MTILQNIVLKYIPSVAIIMLSANLHAQVNNFGNLYLSPGANVSVGSSFINTGSATDFSNSGNFLLAGDFINNGNDFNTAGTGSVTFNGTAPQHINGSQASTFYNVTQTNATNVLLGGNQTIQNTFTLTAGSFALNGFILKLNGGVTHSSGSIASTAASALVLAGSNAKNLYFKPDSNFIKDFTVMSTASAVTLDDSLNITAGNAPGTITVDGALNTGNYLTLKSDINGTARIATSSGAVNGDVIVERYIATGIGSMPNHGKSWQLLATPTTGQTIKDAWQEGASVTDISSPAAGSAGNPHTGYGTMVTGDQSNAVSQGFDIYTSIGSSVKVYSSVTNSYVGPANTNSTAVYNPKGYFVFVRGDRSVVTSSGIANPTILRTKGTLFTAMPSHLPPVTTVAINSFESIGNPYASPVDLRKIARSANVSAVFQVWDPRLAGGYNYGAFQTFIENPATGNYEVTPGSGSYGTGGSINNFIQSGQAFFVQTSSAGSGTVSFSENAKSVDSTLTYLFTRTSGRQTSADHTNSQLRISLNVMNTADSATLLDGVLDMFADSYSDNVDKLDAKKAFNTGENFSIKTHDTLLVVERRQPYKKGDTLFLNLTGLRVEQYRFMFDPQNMETGLEAFLLDSYANTRQQISTITASGNDFTVENVAGSYAANRFMIVFDELNALPVSLTSVKAYTSGKNIDVTWQTANELNVQQYKVEKSLNASDFASIANAKPKNNNGGSASYIVQDSKPAGGYNYYRIKSIDITGAISYTFIVKVFIESSKQDITIYPNPVVNRQIHLQFLNEPSGKYCFRIYSKIGQLIYEKQIMHDEASAGEIINCNQYPPHGAYQAEITLPDGSIKVIEILY